MRVQISVTPLGVVGKQEPYLEALADDGPTHRPERVNI